MKHDHSNKNNLITGVQNHAEIRNMDKGFPNSGTERRVYEETVLLRETEIKIKPPGGLGVRHVQALMWFFALVIGFGMRITMSMAIVVMTDPNAEDHFDWSIKTQGLILSSFFWGYLMLQVPAGELATRFGGKILVIIAITVNSLVSFLIPAGAHYGGWQLVCACRVLQGLTQGCLFPSLYSLIGKWAPVEEKSRMGAFMNSGSHLGTASQMLLSGLIAASWGWPTIFYVNGVIGLVWVVIFAIVGADSPQTSKFISDEERLYIHTSLGQLSGPKKLRTPWKSIWTSVPFITLLVLHCCQNYGFYTLMTEMPSYLNKVLGVDIRANGIISSIPYLAMYVLTFPFGFFSDYIINKGWLSITTTRKISNSIGYYGPAVALTGLTYIPAGNLNLAVITLTIVVGLNVGHITGLMLIHLDLSPNFVGTLLGITNMSSNVISIIAPIVVGLILKDETNATEWRNVFYIASAFWIVGNTLFLIFGTCEKQAWNDPPGDKDRPTDDTTEKQTDKNV